MKTISYGKRASLLLLFLVFATVFCLVSLPNHYFFRTYALDLGMFNHALYNAAHLQQNIFTLSVNGIEMNYLGCHFSPLIWLYAPLYYVFGSYTLLIVQVAAILFGGWGVYRLAMYRLNDHWLSLLITLQFFGIWGIYSALAFDFHENVIGTMCVPWFVLAYFKRSRYMFLFFALILLSKENLALWMVFIVPGLVFLERNFSWRRLIRLEVPLLLIAGSYFLIVTGVLMPWLSGWQQVDQFARYGGLGSSVTEIALNILRHPKHIFELLFESTQEGAIYRGIKSELHFMVLVSGGFALFYRPALLVMLIPIYLQKLLTDNAVMWGISLQYSIEFAPVLSLGMILFLERFRTSPWRFPVILLVVFTTFFYNYKVTEQRRALWYDSMRANTDIFSEAHYRSELDTERVHSTLQAIPDDATISATSELAPHLAFRKRIYLFPNTRDAAYIVLLKRGTSGYPLSAERYQEELADLRANSAYLVVKENDDLVIFKRRR